MSDDLERALEQARTHQREVGWSDAIRSRAAAAAVLAAERALAAARGEPYADEIDIGVEWSTGAPLPHVVSNTSRAFIVCHAAHRDPAWDGTSPRSVSPSDPDPELLAVIELTGCMSIRFGAPNDEALGGHPLYGKGLQFYRAHEVHNSPLLEEHIRINSVHPQHSDARWRQQHHYVLTFHDEMFEALARDIQGRLVYANLRDLLTELSGSLVDGA